MTRLLLSIVFSGIFLAAIPAAEAQTTPQTYCATTLGCEVLGVHFSGGTISGYERGYVEYCRSGTYKTAAFVGSLNTSNLNSTTYFGDGSSSYVTVSARTLDNTTLCGNTTALP